MKANLYTLNLEEKNGRYRILYAEKINGNSRISRHARVNARKLAREIEKGRMVIN